MRRWNGWGNDSIDYPLPEGALAFIEERIGPGSSLSSAAFDEVVAQVPPSRLPAHALVNNDPTERLRHARGQSFPDWVAFRSGQIKSFPDGVAYPMSQDDVRELLRYAQETDVCLIPYGGGTSVVGHINPLANDRPVLTVNMGRLHRLLKLDATTRLATFSAGVSGPNLEAQLRAQGYTLGHYPQSFEYSTLGGWIATRSSGQQSLHYGRIENLFAGGHLETPAGSLELPSFPASAAGPDLRELVLGSEGRLGIITQATVRISPLPETETFRAMFFPDFASGMAATRQMVQARLPLSMLRLSNAVETETTLTLAGHRQALGILQKLLARFGAGEGKCLLMLGYTGNRHLGKAALHEAYHIARQHGGVHLYVGGIFGAQWQKSRFLTPYLRNTLWGMGYAVDTLETATTWSNTANMVESIENALHGALASEGERIHAFTHISHVYPHGASVYTTYIFRLAAEADENLRRWQLLKKAASQAVVEQGGTISHQHGVGRDHLPYLPAEKGTLGIRTLQHLFNDVDPQGIMNPGKLVQEA